MRPPTTLTIASIEADNPSMRMPKLTSHPPATIQDATGTSIPHPV